MEEQNNSTEIVCVFYQQHFVIDHNCEHTQRVAYACKCYDAWLQRRATDSMERRELFVRDC